MPSQEFEDVFCCAGTTVATCGFCGVNHFSRAHMDEDELVEILKSQKAEPEKYIEHEWDFISWGHLGSTEFVPDCECNGGDNFEQFIWVQRNQILEYLRLRSSALSMEAKVLEKDLKETVVSESIR
jgi:hypothetical protein